MMDCRKPSGGFKDNIHEDKVVDVINLYRYAQMMVIQDLIINVDVRVVIADYDIFFSLFV